MAKFISVLHSGARSTPTNSTMVSNWENNYVLQVVVDVTSGSNLIVSVIGRDEESDKDYTLLTSSPLASGTSVLRVGPAYTAGTNIAQDYLPYEFYIKSVPSGLATYSIGAAII